VLSQLGRSNGPCHRQGTKEKHTGVDRSKFFVEERTAKLEYLRIPVSVQRIGAEHATKEEDFRDQKQPHPEFPRVELLLCVIKVMRQPAWVFMVVPVSVIAMGWCVGLLYCSHVLN
jgi:hypothetical protein